MNKLIAAAVVFSSVALAQVNVDINVALPQIHFEAPPPLVVVQPGVQVVENYDEDLYVADGYYWVRRDGRWYRARDHRGGWAVVEERYVPVSVAHIPPGHYKHWKHKEIVKKEVVKREVVVVPASAHEERHERHDDDHGKGHGKGHKH
jgi:hypothetical protein